MRIFTAFASIGAVFAHSHADHAEHDHDHAHHDHDDHAHHDHSKFKPTGVYWGIKVHEVRADKVWTLAEVELNFKSDDRVDLRWFYGVKPNHFVNIPKQVFSCSDIAYSFDEAKLELSVNPDSDPCLREINEKFNKQIRLPNPFILPINETNNGDIIFAVARNMVRADLYPIHAPLTKFPSGSEDGLAPSKLAYPPRRGAVTVSPMEVTSVPSVAPKANAAADNDSATKGAGASQLSSIFVSIGAVVLAGLFL